MLGAVTFRARDRRRLLVERSGAGCLRSRRRQHRLHVEVEGEGEPVTVFAHGSPTAWSSRRSRRWRRGRRCASASADMGARARRAGTTPSRTSPTISTPSPRRTARRGGRDVARAGAIHICSVATPTGSSGSSSSCRGAGPEDDGRCGFDHVADLLDVAGRRGRRGDRLRLERRAEYDEKPWLRELDLFLWQVPDALGVARSIREITRDTAISDRELLRKVTAPTLVLDKRATRSIRSRSHGSWST